MSCVLRIYILYSYTTLAALPAFTSHMTFVYTLECLQQHPTLSDIYHFSWQLLFHLASLQFTGKHIITMHMHEVIQLYTYIHIYIHAYIHTYIHIYTQTYIHTYIHAHTHTHTHTHTYTHTHMHILLFIYISPKLNIMVSLLLEPGWL